MIRDERGRFRVIEDNVGFVGGIGDLEALAAACRVLGVPVPPANHPRKFYRQITDFYKHESRRSGGGKTILLSYPRARRWNNEDDRLARILNRYGFETISNFRKLKVTEDGLFHGNQRVGFVIVNVASKDVDPPDSKSNYRIANFWRAVSDGQFGVSDSPAFEFIGDKGVCPVVEKLVRHYLNETCLLPTLPTVTLDKVNKLDRVRSQRDEWVIKLRKGQSGESVWVGRHITERAWAALFKRVAKNPENFIAQRFCEASQFFGHTVDLRPLALITPNKEIVSPIPWARAAKNENSKTNISRGGLLAPVAIIADGNRKGVSN